MQDNAEGTAQGQVQESAQVPATGEETLQVRDAVRKIHPDGQFLRQEDVSPSGEFTE